MAVFSEAQRRLAHEQAAASARISGHVPTPEFEADCEAVIVGTMTDEQARARSLARALAKDRAASGTVGDDVPAATTVAADAGRMHRARSR